MDLNGRVKIADFGISAYVDNTLAVVRDILDDHNARQSQYKTAKDQGMQHGVCLLR